MVAKVQRVENEPRSGDTILVMRHYFTPGISDVQVIAWKDFPAFLEKNL